MPEAVQKMVDDKFGGMDELKKKMIDAGTKHFGSGWLWLTKDGVKCTSNAKVVDTPLLVVDLWEHAYYPQYFNDRKAYLNAIWNVLNWSFVEENL